MSVKNEYEVYAVRPHITHEWLKYKHYAKRVPLIVAAYGLYQGSVLKGVCTFGNPPRAMNNGECIFDGYSVKTLELNRLCIDDNLPKNTLSLFVSSVLKMIQAPCCVVSYADDSKGHNGYIYQATNWIYTGKNQVHDRQIFLDGVEVHPRTAVSKSGSVHKFCEEHGAELGEYTFKHRYIYFLGTKKEKKKMHKNLKYKRLKYPKGVNKRYDSSYKVEGQAILF